MKISELKSEEKTLSQLEEESESFDEVHSRWILVGFSLLVGGSLGFLLGLMI